MGAVRYQIAALFTEYCVWERAVGLGLVRIPQSPPYLADDSEAAGVREARLAECVCQNSRQLNSPAVRPLHCT